MRLMRTARKGGSSGGVRNVSRSPSGPGRRSRDAADSKEALAKGGCHTAPLCMDIILEASAAKAAAIAAAHQQKDDPDAVTAAAVVAKETAVAISAAAHQQDNPDQGGASSVVGFASTSTVCCS